MLSMMDGELIKKMKMRTFIRIQDLMVLRDEENKAHPGYKEMCAHYGIDPAEIENPSIEVLQEIWSSSLQAISTHILWAVLERATEGVFIASDENMASIIAAINVDREVAATGMQEVDVPVVFKHLCDSLVAIIMERDLISTHINRQPIWLKKAV